jgi:hypothetical protein
MANLFAIHSVGNSLATYLTNAYQDSPSIPADFRAANACKFELISSGEMTKENEPAPPTLSLFLYRVTINEHVRNTSRPSAQSRGDIPLSLDLHYLMTVWASGPLVEHTILAWAMRELYANPLLDVSSLSPEAGWAPDDVIQLIPSELSTEDIMRIWDALDPPYRLSVSYIARVVRLEAHTTPDALPVVATRYSWRNREDK